VKKWLKSVHIYGSYRKNKTGVPFFGPPCIYHKAPFKQSSQRRLLQLGTL